MAEETMKDFEKELEESYKIRMQESGMSLKRC